MSELRQGTLQVALCPLVRSRSPDTSPYHSPWVHVSTSAWSRTVSRPQREAWMLAAWVADRDSSEVAFQVYSEWSCTEEDHTSHMQPVAFH